MKRKPKPRRTAPRRRIRVEPGDKTWLHYSALHCAEYFRMVRAG